MAYLVAFPSYGEILLVENIEFLYTPAFSGSDPVRISQR